MSLQSGRAEGQHCKSVRWGWSLYTAFTSPNWCTEAGAGGNLQECQPSIPEALPPAHLIKVQIDGAGSSMSITEGPSGNYTDRLRAQDETGKCFRFGI